MNYSCHVPLSMEFPRQAYWSGLPFPSGIWNLGVFSPRCTGESLPLRVDFIHRVEFGEVSGVSVILV